MQELLETLRQLPDHSGVYHYFDSHGKLLYVGKAKSLKQRVKNYFRFTPTFGPANNLSPRIFKMISETAHLKYILVESEHDALILENSLIKQLKPKYNILLRDDKTFPYIYIDRSESYPRPDITRKILRGRKIDYYGPFTLGARDILDSVYELLPLVQKKSCLRGKKLCLFHQIEKCLGPCEGRVTPEAYGKILKQATALITEPKLLIKALQERMGKMAESMRFEEAATLRDRIDKIGRLEQTTPIDLAKQENLDIFAIAEDSRRAMLITLFMREGKIVSSSHKPLKRNERFDRAEAYKRALLGAYQDKLPLPPKQVLLPESCEDQEALQEHVSRVLEKNVEIVTPQRGAKKRLLEMALLNARELLKLETSKSELNLQEQIKELLQLEEIPERFEVFDTSHLRGEANVGSVVIYENGFQKESYRHYNLESQDEYGQMRELLQRRMESFEKNGIPDLWVIDGGQGQLNIATSLLQSIGANLDVVAIAKEKIDAKAHRAKGAARDSLYSVHGKFELSTTDPRLMFFQKLRDEAHRFAITFHRKQRSALHKEFELLKLKGIGEAKLKRLLDYFGTFENISSASLEELKTIISDTDAQAIKKYYE